MTHAEKCPVCQGAGKVQPNPLSTPPQPCHGCHGTGWVTVYDYMPVAPLIIQPLPQPAPMPIWYEHLPYNPWESPFKVTCGTLSPNSLSAVGVN